jgi:hypothetical protein
MAGKTISDVDRRLIKKALLGESGKTISDADRRRIEKALAGESGKTISDADRSLIMEKFLDRNDGGIARKTRRF